MRDITIKISMSTYRKIQEEKKSSGRTIKDIVDRKFKKGDSNDRSK